MEVQKADTHPSPKHQTCFDLFLKSQKEGVVLHSPKWEFHNYGSAKEKVCVGAIRRSSSSDLREVWDGKYWARWTL